MARILIVDDSPTQSFTLKKIVSKHGHEVLTADDGEQGVAAALRELPDLILMDVVMPKLNGFQATRRISRNEKTKHIPIILVTTKGEETDKIWGQRQGAKSYVTKPVDEDDLMKNINALLKNPAG